MHITWILYQAELGLCILGEMACHGTQVVAQWDYANCHHTNFCLKYQAIHIQLSNKLLCLLIEPNKKCNNEVHLIIFHHPLIFMCSIFVDSANLENLLLLKIF